MNRVSWLFAMVALLAVAIFVTDFDNDSFEGGQKNSAQTFANSQLPENTDIAMGDTGEALSSAHELIDNSSVARTDLLADDVMIKWARVANSEDQDERNAVINALVSAPKAQALPLLQRLIIGSTEGDRDAALQALRTIANKHGDAGGEIQNILRLTIYDGDDAIVASAQSVLGDIESADAQSALENSSYIR